MLEIVKLHFFSSAHASEKTLRVKNPRNTEHMDFNAFITLHVMHLLQTNPKE